MPEYDKNLNKCNWMDLIANDVYLPSASKLLVSTSSITASSPSSSSITIGNNTNPDCAGFKGGMIPSNIGKLEPLTYEMTGSTSFNVRIEKQANKVLDKIFGKIRIIYNDPATIVFWGDGTKTVVKRAKGEKYNQYNAFCAALAKKIYGNNSRVTKAVNSGFVQNQLKDKSKTGEGKKK